MASESTLFAFHRTGQQSTARFTWCSKLGSLGICFSFVFGLFLFFISFPFPLFPSVIFISSSSASFFAFLFHFISSLLTLLMTLHARPSTALYPFYFSIPLSLSLSPPLKKTLPPFCSSRPFCYSLSLLRLLIRLMHHSRPNPSLH